MSDYGLDRVAHPEEAVEHFRDSYTLAWTWAKNEDGVLWVNWFLLDRFQYDGETTPTFSRRDAQSSPPVGDQATQEWREADYVASGFVKWDGCTQFTVDAHVDARSGLDVLLAAIVRARMERALEMGAAYDSRTEYP